MPEGVPSKREVSANADGGSKKRLPLAHGALHEGSLPCAERPLTREESLFLDAAVPRLTSRLSLGVCCWGFLHRLIGKRPSPAKNRGEAESEGAIE